jgi:hypothetical protein
MNLNNVGRKVAFHINNDIWANVENLVDERARFSCNTDTMEFSWSSAMVKVDSIFKNVSISVVDTIPPKWFFQFYRLY